MRIAFIDPSPDRRTAATELLKRFVEACHRIGWDGIAVATSNEILRFRPDCVLALHGVSPKLTEIPTLGVLWDPSAFQLDPHYGYNHEPIKHLLSWDGYLPGSPQMAEQIGDLLWSVRKNAPVADFSFFHSCPATDLTERPSPERSLIYADTGADSPDQTALVARLMATIPIQIFSPAEKASRFGSAYRGEIPFDGISMVQAIGKAGIALCLHKPEHRKAQLVAVRVFEAAAAGAIIIADSSASVREIFGDSILHVDIEQPPENIIRDISAHMDWIQKNPPELPEMVAKAHAIFTKEYCLETQLQRLPAFLDRVRNAGMRFSPGPPASPDRPAEVEIVVRIGSRPVHFIRRCLDSLANQSFGRIGVILVQFEQVDGLEELLDSYRDAFSSIKRLTVPPPHLRSSVLWAGLAAVTAPLFGMCDDDDRIHTEHVATLVQLLNGLPGMGVAYSGTIRIEERPDKDTGEKMLDAPVDPQAPEDRSIGRFFKDFDRERPIWLRQRSSSNAWLARRELLDERLLQDPRLSTCEDTCLWAGLLERTECVFSWRPTAEYFVRKTSREGSHFTEPESEWDRNRNRNMIRYLYSPQNRKYRPDWIHKQTMDGRLRQIQVQHKEIHQLLAELDTRIDALGGGDRSGSRLSQREVLALARVLRVFFFLENLAVALMRLGSKPSRWWSAFSRLRRDGLRASLERIAQRGDGVRKDQ